MGAHVRRVCAAAAVACAIAPFAARSAGADDDWSVRWNHGIQVTSADKAFSLKLGGRIQGDFTFVSEDPALTADVSGDGFEFRRARLFLEGTVYERIEFKAEYDFATGDPVFNDVWIGINGLGPGLLQVGHFKEPFSLEVLTNANFLPFVERALPIEAFVPFRNTGVGYRGGNDLVSYGVGAFYDSDDIGITVDEESTNLTGRVAFRPLYEEGGARVLHLGVSASFQERGAGGLRYRTRPEAHFSGRLVDTGVFPADGATLLGGEAAGVFGPFWFTGEYVAADTDAPAAGDPSFDGAFVAAGWYLTGERRAYRAGPGVFDRIRPAKNFGGDGNGAWEIAARISTIDLTDGGVAGGEQDNYTLALNWYLNPATRMMLDWMHADVDQAGEADFVVLRCQVDF